MPAKTGLDALLRPEDSILVLIDHQPYQFANLNSHEIGNNVIGLAKAARPLQAAHHEGIAAAEGVEPVARPGPGQRLTGYGESEQLQRGELKESFLLQHIREVALDRLASSPAPTM
jgi:hypothetical protein